MAGFLGLKTSYALFIIVLMVLGIVAGAFYFYNAANQNPCGNPGNPQFTALSDRPINGTIYHAVAAKFTGTNQGETISSVTFLTKAFNNPQFPHLVNGACVSDTYTPASVTVQVTFLSGPNAGLQEPLSFTYGGLGNSGHVFTSNDEAGLWWNQGDAYVTLLVSSQI